MISFILAAALVFGDAPSPRSDEKPAPVLIEAETLQEGGWVIDQQFMDQMGSPFLLAHGLGKPVTDASGKFKARPGSYRLWVRTRDWVAPWGAKGAPGRFQVKVNGAAVATEFGTEGAAWHWQDGGTVELNADNDVALHDLTGFEGRCDALYFSPDLTTPPPAAGPEAAAWRRQLLGLPEKIEEAGPFDLVVVGGGIAGSCAAVCAAREGLKVALVQDRFVLGGNGSSEVRVQIEGLLHQKPWPAIGNLVQEFDGDRRKNAWPGRGSEPQKEDLRRLELVKNQPGLSLFTGFRVNAADVDAGKHIHAVIAQDIRSGRRLRFSASYFADCTGDACVGAYAKAEFTMKTKGHMGASNLWNQELGCGCKDLNEPLSKEVVTQSQLVLFPRCPWAVDLSDKPFPGRGKSTAQWKQAGASNFGDWFWESGFDRHPIDEMEQVRDQNLRAMYGAWDALKNVDKAYPDRELAWAAFIAGKRESRILIGDVVISGDDFRKSREWPDAAFPCTWHLDLHFPDPKFIASAENDPFISRATDSKEYKYKGPYWAPYRSLYSRNIDNLWMAGRNISVDGEALGATRVMRTCGMMGEIVGLAAGIAKRRGLSPRGVYETALPELREKIVRGVLPPEKLAAAKK